jgi:hypothetical protein
MPWWPLNLNPVFHNSGEICDKIITKAEAAFHHLAFSDKETEDIISEFPNFQDDQGQFEVPEFHLVHSNLKGDTKKHGKITADAFKIQVAKADAGLLRRVLEVAFGLESNQSDYLFILYSLRSDNSAVYAQLLGKQTNMCKTTAIFRSLALPTR